MLFLLLFVAGLCYFRGVRGNEVVEKGYLCASDADCTSTDCQNILKVFRDEFPRSSWNLRHPSLYEHYKRYHCKRAVEVGIARGELVYFFLKHFPDISEYYAVDPFLGGYDEADIFSNILTNFSSTAWTHAILHKMKRFDNCRFRLFHNYSENIIHHFPDNSVDCIFIDGDHTYRGVQKDIMAWYPKLRVGGALTFDDVSDNFNGTKRAVNEFAQMNQAHFKLIKINNLGNYYIEKTVDTDKTKFWR